MFLTFTANAKTSLNVFWNEITICNVLNNFFKYIKHFFCRLFNDSFIQQLRAKTESFLYVYLCITYVRTMNWLIDSWIGLAGELAVYTARQVLADFAICHLPRYCKALCDVKLRQIEGNGRTFRHIKLKVKFSKSV